MRFGLLGALFVADDQGHPLALGAPKQSAALVVLLLHANDVVSSDRLIQQLWGDESPPTASKSLQVHISRLRRALRRAGAEAAERLVTRPGGYLLRVAPGELDVECFERLVREADGLVAAERWEAAGGHLREALELWRGDPLSDFSYEPFAQTEIARLAELRLSTLEQRIAVDVALGRVAVVIGELERLVREHPYRERLQGQLMLALYRTGRQADALAVFREVRSRLIDELGIEPSAELRELQGAILAQEPSLASAAPPQAVTSDRPRPQGERSFYRPRLLEAVTLLLTDIEGSTRLARRLGWEGWIAALDQHRRILVNAISAHGGKVDNSEGDAVVALFPEAPEAVAAAVEAQRAFERHPWPEDLGRLKVRMGLHTGVVAPHESGFVGIDAHLAARVANAANGGQILITAATRRLAGEPLLVRDLGEHRLKDFPEPERLFHVFVDGVATDVVPVPRSEIVRPTNLPPQTRPLVGRREERAEILALLRDPHRPVITLTGMGGIGKTRLAAALAADLLDDLPGGVFLVRLAGIADPQSILPMIAEAAGLTGEADESLASLLAVRLGRLPTLLILDNFEQLVDGAPIVGELAAQAGQLRILATSQVPLRISAETVVQLGPLGSDDAASLFLERAQARDRAFAPAAHDDAIIATICERVDRMPLAIELAAARAGGLGLRELERRLESPLGLLTRGDRDLPDRHRSLRAAIEWSQALLSAEEMALFAALGACAGPVPLGMVEAIAGTGGRSPSTLDQLDALLESSFVRRREDLRLGLRFLMPQALRNYAAERLTESGTDAAVRLRHAQHVADLAYPARLWKWGATDEERAALLAVGLEIRPAVAWAREHDPPLHVRLCSALASYWVYRGVISEAVDEFRWALDSGAGSADERARCLTLLAQSLRLQSGGEQALDLVERAYAEWQQVDDTVDRALGYGDLSWIYRWAGRLADAVPMCEEALTILRRTHDRRLILRALVFLAHAYDDLEDVESAERVLAEAGELAGDDPTWELDAIRADCALYRGDNTRAIELYAKSLAWTSQSGESHQMLMDLRCLGISLGRAGHAEAALELIELIRLHEEQTGRAGNISSAVAMLQDSRARSLQLAGPDAQQAAAARARAVPASLRVQRALELSARAAAGVAIN
jgi:predicted ATPase/DNA-binding SARP family transcriptional activator